MFREKRLMTTPDFWTKEETNIRTELQSKWENRCMDSFKLWHSNLTHRENINPSVLHKANITFEGLESFSLALASGDIPQGTFIFENLPTFKFRGNNFINISFKGSNLFNFIFIGCEFYNCDFNLSKLIGCKFVNCSFTVSQLDKAMLKDCVIKKLIFNVATNPAFYESKLENVTF